jgi:hypothetical protein
MVKHLVFAQTMILVLLLSGCSKSILDNDDARCPFADRGGCQSVEMVNRMVIEKRYTPDGQFVQQASSLALRSK